MVLIFSSAILAIITVILLHPEILFKGDALKNVRKFDKVRAGFGLTTLLLGLILSLWFVSHFLSELRWLVILFLGLMLLIVGTVSASSFLSVSIKNEEVQRLFVSVIEFYNSLKKVFTSRYLAYFFIAFSVFAMIFSVIIDFK